MTEQLILHTKTGQTVNAILKQLDLSYLDQLLALQESVYDALPDKELFVKSTREEITSALDGTHIAFGIITEDHQVVALGIYKEMGLQDENYGYDLRLSKKDLFKVGQIDTTIVDVNFRGNGLQHLICSHLEKISRKNHMSLLCATVSPHNTFSLNTFLKLGYEIRVDKMKYDGVRRYVVAKNIESTY